MTNSAVDELIETVRAARQKVEEEKRLYYSGYTDYDRMATAGKELADAMYAYQKAKYPAMRIRKVAYQSLIR